MKKMEPQFILPLEMGVTTAPWIMCKQCTLPCHYTGYFVQWFKIFASPVYQTSACLTACSLSLLCASPSKASLPPHTSFNSNSLLWLFSSSLHTHLFACHFPFMSITFSLHFRFPSSGTARPLSHLLVSHYFPPPMCHSFPFFFIIPQFPLSKSS